MINMQTQSEEQMHHKHVQLLVSPCGVNGGGQVLRLVLLLRSSTAEMSPNVGHA